MASEDAEASQAPEDSLASVLREARPEWSEKDLTNALSKLDKIKITSTEALAKALAGDALNEQLKQAELKAFASETLKALRELLDVKRQKKRAAKGKAKKKAKKVDDGCQQKDQPTSVNPQEADNTPTLKTNSVEQPDPNAPVTPQTAKKKPEKKEAASAKPVSNPAVPESEKKEDGSKYAVPGKLAAGSTKTQAAGKQELGGSKPVRTKADGPGKQGAKKEASSAKAAKLQSADGPSKLETAGVKTAKPQIPSNASKQDGDRPSKPEAAVIKEARSPVPPTAGKQAAGQTKWVRETFPGGPLKPETDTGTTAKKGSNTFPSQYSHMPKTKYNPFFETGRQSTDSDKSKAPPTSDDATPSQYPHVPKTKYNPFFGTGRQSTGSDGGKAPPTSDDAAPLQYPHVPKTKYNPFFGTAQQSTGTDRGKAPPTSDGRTPLQSSQSPVMSTPLPKSFKPAAAQSPGPGSTKKPTPPGPSTPPAAQASAQPSGSSYEDIPSLDDLLAALDREEEEVIKMEGLFVAQDDAKNDSKSFWTCSKCDEPNRLSRLKCNQCGAERPEIQECSDTCNDPITDFQGIPLEKLESKDRAESLARHIQQLQRLTAQKLREECAQRGFATDDFLARDELMSLVTDALIWDELSLHALKEVCSKRGLMVQDDLTRAQLLQWLADVTWEDMGIPVQRFATQGSAHKVLDQVRGLARSCSADLRDRCKKLGLSYEDLEQHDVRLCLRQVSIWHELPTAELRRECQSLSISLEDISSFANEACERAELTGRLVVSIWSGTWLRRHSLDPLTNQDTIRQISRIEVMGSLSLRSEYHGKKILFDSRLADDVLRERLIRVIAWETMPLAELTDYCEKHGVEVICHKDTWHETHLDRKQMIEALVLATWTETWQARGLPATRLGSLKVAEELMHHIDRLRDMSTESLKEEYSSMGVPFDFSLEIDSLAERLKTVLVWRQLPMQELKQECEKKGVALDDTLSGVSESVERKQRINKLIFALWRDTWEVAGVPAERLGNIDTVVRLMAEANRLQQMDVTQLRKEFAKKGVSNCFDLNLQESQLRNLARDMLVWEYLPIAELRREYDERNNGRPSDWFSRAQLQRGLFEATCLTHWEAQGVPAASFNNFDTVANLFKELNRISVMRDDQLLSWYVGMGFPAEKDLDCKELQKLLRLVTMWEMLPFKSLVQEAEKRGVQAGIGEEERHLLVGRLFQRECMNGWEARGFQAHRINDIKVVACVVAEYAEMQALSSGKLKQACSDAGLPCETCEERGDLLKMMKGYLVWKSLPLAELQKECMEHNLSVQVDPGFFIHGFDPEEEARSQLVQRLVIDTHVDSCRSYYESRGIPVGRLGSMPAAAVAKQFSRIESMSPEKLREECGRYGIPVQAIASKDELSETLRKVVVWEALPVAELLHECHQLHVPMKGFNLAGSDDEQRAELLDAVMLRKFRASFEAADIPIIDLESFKACSAVFKEWQRFDSMASSGLQLRYTQFGGSSQYLDSAELKERLRKIAVWVEMPLDSLRHVLKVKAPGIMIWQGRLDIVKRLIEAFWPPRPPPRSEQQRPPPPTQPRPWENSGSVVSFFSILNLPASAGLEDVKKAYKKLALKYHPDKNPGPYQGRYADRFRDVVTAYEALVEHFKNKKNYSQAHRPVYSYWDFQSGTCF